MGPASVRLARCEASERRLARIMREMSTVSRYAVRVSSLVPHTGFSSKIGTCRHRFCQHLCVLTHFRFLVHTCYIPPLASMQARYREAQPRWV